jgi:hypothetical protein
MVDVVLWYHKQKLHRLGEKKVDPFFYADDGLLAVTDEKLLQRSLDIITEGCLSIGFLKMNAVKMEFMVATGMEGRTMRSLNADM